LEALGVHDSYVVEGTEADNEPPAKTKADAKAFKAAVAFLGKQGTATGAKSRTAKGNKRAK
jgi:hypothetical protein